jgi:hypothetical protein
MANNYLHLAMEESPRYEGAPSIAPYRVSTTGVFLPTTAGRINANPAFMDRGAELRNTLSDPPQPIDGFAPDGAIAERAYVNHLAYLYSLAGLKATITAGDGTNNVWSLVWGGTAATGGTFTITVGGQTTAPIAYNATDAVIQAALEALTSVGAGNVLVATTAGGPLPTNGTKTLTFRRALGAITQTVTASAAGLTGGAPTITPTSTTPAVAPTVTNPDWQTGHTFATNPQSFVGPGSYKLVFAKRSGSQAQTAQITAAYGDMGVWLRGQGYAVSDLSMNAAGEVTTSLVGLVVASIADPALSPTYDAASVLPLRRGDLTLTWLTGGGTVDDFTYTLTNPLNAVRSMGIATPSQFPDVMEFGDDPSELTGSIPKRRFSATDWAALVAGTTFSTKARWLAPGYVGDSSSRYAQWIEQAACQYTQGTPDELMSRRRWGATFNWKAFYDETAGYDFRITLVCGVSAAALSSPFTI